MSTEIFETAPNISCNPSPFKAKKDRKRLNPHVPIYNEKLKAFFDLNDHQDALYQGLLEIEVKIHASILEKNSHNRIIPDKEAELLSIYAQNRPESVVTQVNSLEDSLKKYEYKAIRRNPNTGEDLYGISCVIEYDEVNNTFLIKDQKINLSKEVADLFGSKFLEYQYLGEIAYTYDEAIKCKPENFVQDYLQEKENIKSLDGLQAALKNFLENADLDKYKESFKESLLFLHTEINDNPDLDASLGYDLNDKINILCILFKKVVKKNHFINAHIPLLNGLCECAEKGSVLHTSLSLLLEVTRKCYPLSAYMHDSKEILYSRIDEKLADNIKFELKKRIDKHLNTMLWYLFNAIQNLEKNEIPGIFRFIKKMNCDFIAQTKELLPEHTQTEIQKFLDLLQIKSSQIFVIWFIRKTNQEATKLESEHNSEVAAVKRNVAEMLQKKSDKFFKVQCISLERTLQFLNESKQEGTEIENSLPLAQKADFGIFSLLGDLLKSLVTHITSVFSFFRTVDKTPEIAKAISEEIPKLFVPM